MFTLMKVFNYIIFPPSIFILILLAALFYIRNSRRKAVIIIITDIVLLYTLSIGFTGNLIYSPLENYAVPINLNEKPQADYIVVLGGGAINSSPEEEGRGSLPPEAMKRALYGLYLAGIFDIPLIYSGGKVFGGETESESDIALRIMKRYTVKKIKLIKEDRSRTTFENAEFIKSTFNPEKIILVTSAYHMKRSLYSFKRAGIECIPAPTDYKLDNSGYSLMSFIPSTGGMDSVFRGLKEHVGLLFYRIK